MGRVEQAGCRAALSPAARLWRREHGRPGTGQLLPGAEDAELDLLAFLQPEDLARLGACSRALRDLTLLVCRERLRFHMSGHPGAATAELPAGQSLVEDLPLAAQFLAAHSNSVPRLLQMVVNSREQTFRTTLSLGEAHSCVVARVSPSRSAVFTFGEGHSGQLGQGFDEHSVMPTRIALEVLLHDTNACAVACGAAHTSLLTEDGRIVSFGANNAGQLGDGTRLSRSSPAFNKECRDRNGSPLRFTQVVAGRYYTAAITTDGRVAVFGDGLDMESREFGCLVPRGEIPRDERVVQLAAGQEHLLMLTDRNNLYALGNGHHGKLGLASAIAPMPGDESLSEVERRTVMSLRTSASALVPGKVAVPDPSQVIVQIAAGGNHSAYVTSDGSLYTWGGCSNGELGLGRFARTVPQPTRVQLPSASPFALGVSCGKAHTAVLTTCSRILTFGNSSFKQDGKRHGFWATNAPQEIFLGDLETHDRDLSIVVCGGRHTALLDCDGSLFSFGDPMCTGRSLRARSAEHDYIPRLVPLQRMCGLARTNSM